MRLRRLPPSAAALALTAIATLAGCGGGSSSSSGLASKSPTQVLAEAKRAADGAASVHVVGNVVNEGKPLTIDLELLAGKGGRGTITLEGLSIDLVRTARSVYIKGSEAFYRHIAGPAAAQLLKGKWLKAPDNTGNFASLASLTDLAKLIDTTLASHGTLALGATSTVAGQKALEVKDTAQGGILYVASSGSPYPLEISKGGGRGGKIIFDRWNKPVSITAPANAINIKALESGH